MGVSSALRVAMMPAVGRSRVLRALRAALRAHRGLVVSAGESWGAPADVASVRDGSLDALVLVGPADPSGLRVERIGSLGRHVVVADDHALAREDKVTLEHLIDFPTFRRPENVDPAWRSYWLHIDARGGEPRYVGRSTTELDAMVTIGGGRVVGTAPQGWGRVPGLTTRPVVDLSPAPVVLLTRPGDEAGPLSTFTSELRRGDDADLSPAEQRVTALVAEGLSDAQIAQALSLSPRTVECHVASARRRLGLRSRSHLASVAVQLSLA